MKYHADLFLVFENGNWFIDEVNNDIAKKPEKKEMKRLIKTKFDGFQRDTSTPTEDNTVSKEKIIFSNEQYIIGHLLNQRFRHSSGLEIRFDGSGRMFIDGDAAGVISVVRYDNESAILRYGNGMYGEGKLFMQYANGKIQLTDTADGSVFYQK